MASYTPYRPNITDDEWYNFICGFIAGLKLRNKDNGFHETNQIVEDVPIGEEPSDMGIRILPNKYVSLSEISSVLRIPVYSHDVKTSYGAFDVTLSNGTNTVIEGIEASASWKGSLTYRRNPSNVNIWYIEGRSLNNTNDYDKPIVLFYVLVGLNLSGEYEEGREIGFIDGLRTTEYPRGSSQYTYVSELLKYDSNGSLNMIVPSSSINTCWFILKNLNKDGNRVYNNSSSIGDKIRLNTVGLGTKAQTPDNYTVSLPVADDGVTTNYFELPLKILMGEEERSRGVRINHVVIEMTFMREAYGYVNGQLCCSDYLSLSLIVNKNGWSWTSEVTYGENKVWYVRLVGDSLNESYDVYEDTEVLGIGLRGFACPYYYGFYYYGATLEGKDSSNNDYRNYHGSGYKFINNTNYNQITHYPSKAEVAKISTDTPYVTFSGNVYSVVEQDIEMSVLGVYRDAYGNEKEVEFKSGPIHVVAGDNKVETNIALDSGIEVETNSGLNVKSQYAVTVKAGSEFNVDAGVGQYKASDEKDNDSEDRVRVNDIIEFIIEKGSSVYNEEAVEDVDIEDRFNVVYEKGSQTYNEDIVEETEIKDDINVVYEKGSQEYNEETVEEAEIRDISEIVYEQGPTNYSREIVDNININDISEIVYEQGQASEDDIENITGGKGITSKVNISDIVEVNKEGI